MVAITVLWVRMYRPCIRFLLPLVAVLLSGLVTAPAAKAAEASVLRLDGATTESTSLTPYWALMSDPTRMLEVQDVIRSSPEQGFKDLQAAGNAVGLGIRKDAIWLKASINNTSNQAVSRVLEISYASLNLVDVVLVQSDGRILSHQKMGTARPMSAREMPGRFFNAPLQFPPHSELTLLVRVESHAPIIIPAALWEPQAFAVHDKSDYSVQAWYFGLASAMFTFNILLFLALRDKVYLQYLFWLTSMLMTVAVGSGLAKEFLWPEAVGWPPYTNALVDNWAAASLFFFMREMLEVRSHSISLDRLYRALGWLFLLIPLAYLVDFHSVAQVMLVVTSSLAFLILGVAIWVAWRGKRAALIFLVAFSALIASSVIGALWGLNLLPTNFVTVYGFQIGSAVEMILLALALADRVNDSRKAVFAAQAQVLVSERQRVEDLQQSERALEARVTQRTAELSDSLEKLKFAQEELIQAEKLASLGSLVAGVAHELNTPIGNALTVASTLSEEARQLRADVLANEIRKSRLLQFADNVVPMAELIESACHRAADLISSFKRVAVDQTSELRREFDLRDLVLDILAAIRPGMKHQPYSIDIRVPQNIVCNGYPGPLGQVITNLVQNAAVHAFEGRPDGQITISAQADGDEVEVEVSDNGKGITPENRKRIFEPFFTTRLGKGGSGLGLAISTNIARNVLHGALQLQSTPGEGSCFKVRFPRNLPAKGESSAGSG